MLQVKFALHRMDGAISRFIVGAGFIAGAVMLVGKPDHAGAHGFAGDRFFPATILTDDPFVADEMSLPTFTRPPTGADGTHEYDLDFDISKRITPDLGFTLGYGWVRSHTPAMPTVTGFGSPLNTGLQYQLFINPEHELMALAGLNVSWAHTGRVAALGAPDFTTLTPTFDFGKGFGDLPDTVPFIRPFAITGNLSADFPTKTESAGIPNTNNFNYGFAFEYSLEYLQHHVKDVGLTAPFDHMIPLVEVAFTTPLNRITPGVRTTGTVQPGIIWSGPYYQVGAEAILPINTLSGKGLGGLVQLHFYLDDIFPKTIGQPLLQW
jgi:hypothetical protein